MSPNHLAFGVLTCPPTLLFPFLKIARASSCRGGASGWLVLISAPKHCPSSVKKINNNHLHFNLHSQPTVDHENGELQSICILHQSPYVNPLLKLSLYLSCRRQCEEKSRSFHPETVFQACFSNRRGSFKIRIEGTVEYVDHDQWRDDLYFIPMGYSGGHQTIPCFLCCLFGYEKVPQVHHETFEPSQNSC